MKIIVIYLPGKIFIRAVGINSEAVKNLILTEIDTKMGIFERSLLADQNFVRIMKDLEERNKTYIATIRQRRSFFLSPTDHKVDVLLVFGYQNHAPAD